MAKRIIKIKSNSLGILEVGNAVPSYPNMGVIEEIRCTLGVCSEEEYYMESYFMYFENSTKTLEVFDVNYVIRDEE